jgi:asparagine synthase (glutamine-hydrolysing)
MLLHEILESMSKALLHRGPDASGRWVDFAEGIGLAHRRLAILDLSAAGSQPMISPSGRYVLVFNGEIYNHMKLRLELEANGYVNSQWRGHSDTESLLAGFEFWGVVPTLNRAIGMFAFALWDRQLQTLTLARDRLGEKPLYYGWQGEGESVFLFGSELASLRTHPAFTAEICRNSLASFIKYGYIGGASSIYSGINKLAPGHILTISRKKTAPTVEAWWSGTDVVNRNSIEVFGGSANDAVSELEILLRDTLSLQMSADVPIGAFLSGGIDSSTLVALMQTQSSKPVRTFSIGFQEKNYNEAHYAKSVAKHLGTEHTELYVTPADALAVIPKIPTLYSEPFADSSQIPTFLVSQLAREHVTVALSGDGGDELFCGYRRYSMTAKWWDVISAFPYPLRRMMTRLANSISPSAFDKFARFMAVTLTTEKLVKGTSLLESRTLLDLYIGMVSKFKDPGSVVLGAGAPDAILEILSLELKDLSDIERMMALDMLTYLPDDILVKIDRAAMGSSLETRVPFLDHRVVEFAWSLPLNFKLRNGLTKWPLRQILYQHVPQSLIDRPKMGFGVPIDHWLRGPLRDWAESLLSVSRLQGEGFFNPDTIRKIWSEHLSGQRNWQHQLWNVLMFQSWLETQSK